MNIIEYLDLLSHIVTIELSSESVATAIKIFFNL